MSDLQRKVEVSAILADRQSPLDDTVEKWLFLAAEQASDFSTVRSLDRSAGPLDVGRSHRGAHAALAGQPSVGTGVRRSSSGCWATVVELLGQPLATVGTGQALVDRHGVGGPDPRPSWLWCSLEPPTYRMDSTAFCCCRSTGCSCWREPPSSLCCWSFS